MTRLRYVTDISRAGAVSSCFHQMDQYMALSKKDLRINITMNEMYNTHALLAQHLDQMVSVIYLLPSLGQTDTFPFC